MKTQYLARETGSSHLISLYGIYISWGSLKHADTRHTEFIYLIVLEILYLLFFKKCPVHLFHGEKKTFDIV